MYPSILNTFNRPSSTDRLNNPSHSALHNTVSSALGQVEAFIGKEGLMGSYIPGTVLYDVRDANSNGGGHVQTAVKGGTGQTTFTKGDLFVATGPSVISKLAVGNDGQAIVADSSVAAGVKWGTAQGTKIQTNASVITVLGVSEVSILSVVIPGSTLGTSNAVRATAFVHDIITNSSILVRAFYGGGIVASMLIGPTGNPGTTGSISGTLEYNLIANNSATQQRGILLLDAVNQISSVTGTIRSLHMYDMNVSSIASLANQTMGITVQLSDVPAGHVFTSHATIVEKIV